MLTVKSVRLEGRTFLTPLPDTDGEQDPLADYVIDRYIGFPPNNMGTKDLQARRVALAPSAIINDTAVLAQTIAERRGAMGLTHQALKAHGLKPPTLAGIEKNRLDDYSTESVQRICWFFRVRFNWLPFCGPPLTDPREIWHDLVTRALTLGLTNAEFPAYLGEGVADLKALVQDGQPLPQSMWETLTEKLHMRLWPEPPGTLVTNDTELATYSLWLRNHWRMSAEEMSDALDQRFSKSVILDIEGGVKQLAGKHAPSTDYAQALGFRTRGPAQLPRIKQRQYYDDDLTALVRRRFALLGFPLLRVARESKLANDSVRRLLAGDKTSLRPRYRRMMTKLCTYLRIPLVTIKTLPPRNIVLPPPEAGDSRPPMARLAVEVLAQVDDIAEKLYLAPREVGAAAGVNVGSLDRLREGDVSFNVTPVLQRLIKRFNLRVDPFAALAAFDAITLAESEGTKRIAAVLAERYAACLLTHAEATALIQGGRWDVSQIMRGRVAVRNPVLQRLAKLLKVTVVPHPLTYLCHDPGDPAPWYDEALRRCEQMRLDRQGLVTRLGLNERAAFMFGKRRLGWQHPDLLKIALATGLCNRDILQGLFESHHADMATLIAQLGPAAAGPRNEAFFLDYPATAEQLPALIARRMQTLRALYEGRAMERDKIAVDNGFATAAEMETFLARTGGGVSTLKNAPVSLVYYLFSLGDTYSTALHLHGNAPTTKAGPLRRRETISPFIQQYNLWLSRCHGHGVNFNASIADNPPPLHPPGKFLPLTQDRAGLNAAFTAIQNYHYEQTMMRHDRDWRQRDRVGNDGVNFAPIGPHEVVDTSGDGLGIAVTGTVESPLNLSVAPADSPPPPILKVPGFAPPGPGSVRLFAGLGASVQVDEFLPAGADEPASAGVDTAAYPEDTAPWEESAAIYVDAGYDASALAGAGLLMPCVKGVM